MSVVLILCERMLIGVLFALDIAPEATRTTALTLALNVPRQVNSVVQSDLLNGLRFDGEVDVLVFNPPYVPTEGEDSWAGNLGFTWKGGPMGMQTTWRVLNELDVRFLVEGTDGRLY